MSNGNSVADKFHLHWTEQNRIGIYFRTYKGFLFNKIIINTSVDTAVSQNQKVLLDGIFLKKCPFIFFFLFNIL